jgi:hypothetical protein
MGKATTHRTGTRTHQSSAVDWCEGLPMNDDAPEVLPYEEVERSFPGEWVLVEVVQPHNDYRKKRVRLIAHSPDRSDLDEPFAHARAEAPSAVLGEFYTGELVPEGVVVVL